MNRSPWHSMVFQRRFPTSCSPVHVLTHVFSFARSFTCCAWLRVVWLWQHHSLPSPPRAARVEGVDFRLVVYSAMPCLWPLLCVAGNTSSLEPRPRRSARCAFRLALLCSVSPRSSTVVLPPLPALCRRSSHVAALHESALSICVWGDRGSLPWSGFLLLRPPGCTPAEAQSLRLFAAVAAAAVCLVVSGHSSTQTCSN